MRHCVRGGAIANRQYFQEIQFSYVHFVIQSEWCQGQKTSLMVSPVVVTTNGDIHDEMVEFLQSVKTVRGTRDNMFGFGFDMSARTE